MHHLITQDHVDTFQKDGVVLIRGLFCDCIDTIRQGIELNMSSPGPYAAENLQHGDSGRFFDDYCNWHRITQFEKVIRESAAAEVAASLMNSIACNCFTTMSWSKSPVLPSRHRGIRIAPTTLLTVCKTSLSGRLWILSAMPHYAVAGSHRWEKPVLPTRWLAEDDFYPDTDDYQPVPDPDAEGMDVREWPWRPETRLHFRFRRCIVRAVINPLPGVEPFRCVFWAMMPGMLNVLAAHHLLSEHGMSAGERLREDWFPVLFSMDK